MSTSCCQVPGCQRPLFQEDCCITHSLQTHRDICGHLLKRDPSRPCVRSAEHADGRHHDVSQYKARLDREQRRRGRVATNRYNTDRMIPNDGVIDWLAIDIAIKDERPVRLTWVEREIVAAVLFSQDVTLDEIEHRVGVRLYGPLDARIERIKQMGEYVKKHGYHAQH